MKHARTILVDPVQLPLLLCCSTSLQEKAAASGAAREAAQAAEEVRQIRKIGTLAHCISMTRGFMIIYTYTYTYI